MTRHEEWIPFSGRCYNCGAAVTGYKDMKGTVKIECKKCHVVMVRKVMGRRHRRIDLYDPED